MRFCLFMTLFSAPLVCASLAFAQTTTDPESDANTSLGSHAAPSQNAQQAAQPPSTDPALEPRGTPVAKDLQKDDVVVEEIHTQGGPNAKPKNATPPPSDDDSAATTRDTENETRGNAPIEGHDSSAPVDEKAADDGKANAATADQMTMKVRPEGQAAETDADATPAPKQKPRRVQRGTPAAAAKVASQKADKKTDKKSDKKTDKKAEKKMADAAPTSETVLKWLTNGNTRFVKRHFRADGKSPADRARLVKGEHPHAAILASSDSRVVPEIIFDQALGEVYDVRSFGENLDSSTVAALEYAVAKLKVPLIVVMGNSDCAAIRTMLEDKVNENGDHVGDGVTSPDIEKVVADIQPRLKTVKDDPVSPAYEVESALNADAIARELVKRSDIIRGAVEKNGLVIKSALYRLDSGKVSFY